MSVLVDILNKLQHVDPLVYAALGGYVAPYAQELLKQVRDFSERTNYVLGLVVLPAVVALLTGLLQPQVLSHLHPVLQMILTGTLTAVVSQLKYGLSLNPHLQLKAENAALKAQVNGASVQTSPAEVDTAPLVNPATATDY